MSPGPAPTSPDQPSAPSVLAHARVGLLSWSDEGRVLLANAAVHQWLEVPDGRLVGQPLDAVLSPDSLTLHRRHVQPALSQHGRVDDVAWTLRGAAQLAVPVLLAAGRDTSGPTPVNHGVLLPNRHAQAQQALLAGRLTEATQLAAQKDELLAAVAHDLRTPISAILGWVRVMRSGKLDAAMLNKALDTIDRNAKAQADMVNGLLDGSRAPEATEAQIAAAPTLVAASSPAPAGPSKPGKEERISLKGLRVLVVDDDRDARGLLKVLLEGAGASVSTAASSEQALDSLALEGVPDVLLSDVGMPGRDGFALIREIRASKMPWSKTIAAIAVTGRARPQDRVDLLQAGYQAHLCKPVEPAEVLAMVKALARPR
ncbi:MAG: response regulator [Rubrivivax sp.]|nr:MAG: response regulator [Rubrivivax sp.]